MDRVLVSKYLICRRPKCNKVLNTLTFGLKRNKLFKVITLGLTCIDVMLTPSMT